MYSWIRAATAAGITPNSDQLRAGARTADQLRASARTADPNRQLTPASQNSTPSIRTPLSDKSHSLQIWHESLFIEE